MGLKDNSYSIYPESLTGTTVYEPFPGVQNILITGGAGFIGSWVARHYTLKYASVYNVVVLDVLGSVSSQNNLACLQKKPNFTFVQGNILDRESILQVLNKHDIHAVLHFAAESNVQKSFTDPFAFTRMNVIGTHNMLDAMRAHGKIVRYVHASTDEVYGETRGQETDETALLSPTNPYASSKAAAEMYVMAYHKSFGIPAVVLRCNNVFGPCQFPEKIIPKFTGLMMDGQKLTMQGDGTRTRNFLYVSDVVDAYDTVLHRGEPGIIYNVSSSFNVSVRKVADGILTLFGHDPAKDYPKHVTQIPDRPFNDEDYVMIGDRLKEIGWKQRVGFDQGLATSVTWFQENLQTWWSEQSV
ncbi:dTDP-D-glucose 4-6-dehydratase [Penicillium capsulatum]|uniref:dTDP-D-glucose 4-6-dehydratase n=1 Tax=Penicillium capsulatum TaxID=69766 RepID=A0A9W9LEQ3_9EURO|nr:dTDP-D-glucose 4-6-dehydratase [Penicillium capsulatum]KAJ6112358.1 dTDP-D-glucose 4-6-dehydratase [Penicillium capsulatum]